MVLQPSIRHRRLRHVRGFTLVELMVVVLIIGVTATIATPMLLGRMRERRSRDLAQRVAQVYSLARMRALGRGSSVLVRFSRDTGFRVLESIEGQLVAESRMGSGNGASCAARPGLGCLSNNWSLPDQATSTARTVQSLSWSSEFSVTAATDNLDICFTPSGRSFLSTDGNPPRQAMVGAQLFTVKRTDGTPRTVTVLPNGMARLGI